MKTGASTSGALPGNIQPRREFYEGGHIRTRSLLIAVPVLLPVLLAAASTDPIVILVERDRREVVPVVRGGAELVAFTPLVGLFGLAATVDARGGALTLSQENRQITLYDKKSLASVGGDLRLLSAPVLQEEGRWLVPVDSLPRLLGPLLGKRVDWRPTSRVLLVGSVSAPRVAVTTYVSGDTVRVVLESTEKVPFRVAQEEKRVTVAVPRDLVDVSYQQERLTGGIVDLVQFLGGKDNVFAITLGRRFQQLKSSEEEGPPARLILEFQAPAASVARAPAPGPSPGATGPAAPGTGTPPPPAAETTGSLRTVVIDPGHGGAEVGAQGPSGTLEKDVTLAIARKLRAAVANGLGVQAFLTRDTDQEVPLDERAAFANNYKADLFISIHANASRSHGAKGSEVYFLAYQSADEEGRRLAAQEGGVAAVAPAGASADVSLILWDMAQAEHLQESSTLATRIQEQLADVTGSQGRGVKQAPFRVLVGAAMPAVLVEVAFISNAEEERLLGSEAYQNKIVSALVRGVAGYQQQHAQRVGAARAAVPGS